MEPTQPPTSFPPLAQDNHFISSSLSKKAKIFFILIPILILIAALVIFYLLYLNRYLPNYQNISPPAAHNYSQSPTKLTQVPSTWKNYENTNLGLSLSYPPQWEIKEFDIKKGDKYQERNKLEIEAMDGDKHVIKIIKDTNWEIVIEGRKQLVKRDLRIISGGSEEVGFSSQFKDITILNTQAIRVKIEDGYLYSTMRNLDEIVGLPVFFKINLEKPGIYFPGSSVLFGNYFEDLSKSVQLKITYYSSFFKKPNTDKNSSYQETLNEMDKILLTLKFI